MEAKNRHRLNQRKKKKDQKFTSHPELQKEKTKIRRQDEGWKKERKK